MRLILVLCILSTLHVAGESHTIAGAGSSTALVTAFCAAFAATPAAGGATFEVPPKSIKHSGGMDWAKGGTNLLGRSGRPMSDAEKAAHPELRELLLARQPIGFGIAKDLGVAGLTAAQLQAIYTGATTTWKDVGGPDLPVLRLGREPTEAVLMSLVAQATWIGGNAFDKVLKKDDEMLTAIAKTPGAIGFGIATQIAAAPGAQLVTITGFSPSLASGLLYDASKADHPLIQAMIAFASGPAWKDHSVKLGFLPME